MTDLGDLMTATRAVVDPATSAADLAQIAQMQPSLRPQIAVHPNIYPDLLSWLTNSDKATGQAREQTQLPVPAKSKAPRSTVHYLVGGLVGAVIVVLLVVGLVLGGLAKFGSNKGSSGPIASEGPGFDSPEAAAYAFLDGLKAGDLDAMLGTFAIQSFASKCDFSAYTGRFMEFSFSSLNSSCPFPHDSAIGVQANVQARIGNLTASLPRQILNMVSPETNQSGVVSLPDANSQQAFIAQIAADFASYPYAGINNIATTDPASLSSIYSSDKVAADIVKNEQTLGLNQDEYKDVAITLDMGGQTWIFSPSAGYYHGRWYLISANSYLAILLNMDPFTFLMPMP